ncbi:hypothetical protein ANANG_G00279610 [Anguilla anguilla]|uniref:Uncharacterized protein n=1 Tax=Anguilla anguilla TaxID=7936 RepID=A0A9D3RKS1_ANGAN|nr:hypothetical protein ANANG_G00279610 [Anguilla anguilla]
MRRPRLLAQLGLPGREGAGFHRESEAGVGVSARESRRGRRRSRSGGRARGGNLDSCGTHRLRGPVPLAPDGRSRRKQRRRIRFALRPSRSLRLLWKPDPRRAPERGLGSERLPEASAVSGSAGAPSAIGPAVVTADSFI